MFRDIYELWKSNDKAKKLKCNSLLYRILAECSVQKNKNKNDDSKIKESVNYINSRFATPWVSVSDAAELSFMSEVYFRKLFKAEYGISPQKYIIKLRLERRPSLSKAVIFRLKRSRLCPGIPIISIFQPNLRELSDAPRPNINKAVIQKGITALFI